MDLNLSLKEGLKKATGDLFFYSSNGLFELDQDLEKIIESSGVTQYSTIFQTEGFAIKGEKSRGILVKGVDFESFFKISKLNFSLKDNEIAIGSGVCQNPRVKNQ